MIYRTATSQSAAAVKMQYRIKGKHYANGCHINLCGQSHKLPKMIRVRRIWKEADKGNKSGWIGVLAHIVDTKQLKQQVR